MSKYYKAEDIQELITACMWRMTLAKERGGEGFVEYDLRKRLSYLPTIEVSEEDKLKFYYVDSIDDYWIGQRLDKFYYAKWDSKLGFVWSASRYLPWGEHIVDENTLWKEHTYPSEPREIPFTEWIVGFMKKHTSEDAISREVAMDIVVSSTAEEMVEKMRNAPSVIPQAKEGEWKWETNDICHNCGYKIPHLERIVGETVLMDSKDWSFCPNCGSRR